MAISHEQVLKGRFHLMLAHKWAEDKAPQIPSYKFTISCSLSPARQLSKHSSRRLPEVSDLPTGHLEAVTTVLLSS